jgi:ATP-binding cassette, subfamily C, bacterial
MKNKSAFSIMKRLLKMVSPVLPTMLFSIIMGITGNFFAITVMIGGSLLIADFLGMDTGITANTLTWIILICALLRGLLRYLEQYSGHDVAFRLLALIRDKAYASLRKLVPAKLADKSAGEIISTVMGDVEYIEVFFAHTIAPVIIGILIPFGVLLFISSYWYGFALILFAFQLAVGFLIPLFAARTGRKAGRNYRQEASKMGTFLLDSLQGLREIMLLNLGGKRLGEIKQRGKLFNNAHGELKKHEGLVMASADLCVLLAVTAVLTAAAIRFNLGLLDAESVLIVTVAASSSFGPLIALSSLSNSLMQTFASAERLFALMDEKPAVEDSVSDSASARDLDEGGIEYKKVTFQYPKRGISVIKELDMRILAFSKIALIGKSGCGKSTLLHLLLRFWDVDSGHICIDGQDIRKYGLERLRSGITLVTQDTWLFDDSIEENIRIGRSDADDVDVREAAARASVHDFIMKLPGGYKTRVGELGSRLSTGERQRIGLARAFLRNTPVVLMDEPTSGLDTLNEKVILKSINDEFEGKTVILVSHRPSVKAAAGVILRIENGAMVLQNKEEASV